MKFLATIKLTNTDTRRTHFTYVEAPSLEDAMTKVFDVSGNDFVAIKAHHRSFMDGVITSETEYGVVFPASSILEVIFQEA